jgi:zinc transport system ATP-binding protein
MLLMSEAPRRAADAAGDTATGRAPAQDRDEGRDRGSDQGLDQDLDHSPVIAARRTTVSLGGRAVLHGVDLTVSPGETVALLGANGSGKSTLVRTVVGLIPADSGEIKLFGTPLSSFRSWNQVGYVPQRTTAASGVPATVGEVVASGLLAPRTWMRRRTRVDRDAVLSALETVGMASRVSDPVASLSGGQQQRVLIARALARRPDVLIMDEPMAGVDLASQQVFADALARLAAAGTTILLILHELGPLAPLIDRTVVLRGGEVVYDGTPVEHGEPEHDHVHPHAASAAAPGMPECPPGSGPLEMAQAERAETEMEQADRDDAALKESRT